MDSSKATSTKTNGEQANLNDLQSESQLYINSNYSDQFFSELRNLFVKSKFTDVVLICGEKPDKDKDKEDDDENRYVNVSIPCHKLVLSAFSPYFQAMFSSNLLETKTNRVFLPNVDLKTLNDVVNYAYCGSIYLNVNNVQAIFQLSSLFQVKDLYNACCVYMESKLDANNCLEVNMFAKQHMCEYLSSKSKEYISRHIVDLTKSSEFVELDDVGLLEEILTSDDLEVTNEEQLLEALLKWAKYNPSDRIGHYESLFERSIRVNLISAGYLRDFVEKDEKFVSAKVKRIIEDGSENGNGKPRAGMTKAQQCFLLIGGCPDSYDGCYVNCFNPFNGDKYFSSNSFLEKAAYEGKGFFHVEFPGVCVTHDNRLFVAGGLNVFHKLKYSIKTTPLNSDRSNEDPETLLNVRDDLRDGEEVLSKEMFEYDTKNDTWIKRANMLYPKANLSLCAMRNRIYAFGGVSSGQMPLDSVEYYDIDENKWVYAGTMPTPFVAGSVVAYEDKFYVIGGRNGVGRHDCCYIYKPHSNQWIEIAKLNIGRFNFGACVIEDHLYVFGGQRYSESEEHYFTREALDSVEVYELKSGRDEWTLGPKMPGSLYNTGCFVLDEQPSTRSVYLCGTTECHYTGSTFMGFIFTSVFRLDFCNELNNRQRLKWSTVEHDVSEVKAYYRCVGARVNTRKLIKFTTDVRQIHSANNTE